MLNFSKLENRGRPSQNWAGLASFIFFWQKSGRQRPLLQKWRPLIFTPKSGRVLYIGVLYIKEKVYDRFQITGAIWWPFWWNYKYIEICIKYMFSYVKLDGESKYELRKTNKLPKNIFLGVTYKSLYKSARKELGRHFRVF